MEEVKDDDIDKVFLQIQKELHKIKSETKERGRESSGWPEFYGPGFLLKIPAGFEEIRREKAASVFFSKNRPEMVLVNSHEHAGLTFQTARLENERAVMNLEDERERMRQILKRADEKNVFYDQGNVSGNIPVAWFDYKSFAADERVYNMMFLFLSEGKLMIGTFYCIFKDYDRWRPKILKMLGTIQTEEEERERIQS
ncbi:hypothetical protein [Clostridium sp. Marseille-P2415]|uniref:hypothetical protein n=1 Tax=Clostridium sp. Marseille-P2415 TaxID=1805471 RepID=UPI00098890AE|nr:hypothetical protein [Clostridium sp. Marseille-P2415]